MAKILWSTTEDNKGPSKEELIACAKRLSNEIASLSAWFDKLGVRYVPDRDAHFTVAIIKNGELYEMPISQEEARELTTTLMRTASNMIGDKREARNRALADAVDLGAVIS